MSTTTKQAISGPAWDLSTEYESVEAPEFAADYNRAVQQVAEIEGLTVELSAAIAKQDFATQRSTLVQRCQQVFVARESALVLLMNLGTFCSCRLSVDGGLTAEKQWLGKLESLKAQLDKVGEPVRQVLVQAPDDFVDEYLDHTDTAPHRFTVGQERLLRAHNLSLAEEQLLTTMAVDGKKSWGVLYDNLSGSVQCQVELPDGEQTLGLAQTAALRENAEEPVRRAAHNAINRAWRTHKESVASIMNSLAGWRIEEAKLRSHTAEFDFLSRPIAQARIQRETLDTMMQCVEDFRDVSQQAVYLQAKSLNKEKLEVWDLFAPCPEQAGSRAWQPLAFSDGLAMVEECFGSVDSSMAEFVQTMGQNNWIEGQVAPRKRPGAYCTKFIKTRSPRVFLTYSGGMREIKTLAHELGHAFHSWVMRDLPLSQLAYPMTLAETASIFAETVVTESLLEKTQTDAERFPLYWTIAKEVEGLLINVAARYTFEKEFYELRQDCKQTPDDLCELMLKHWQHWYGDSINGGDEMFWASKLHFSIADLSFYNFPYIFGYLFSLGVYARREEEGDAFFGRYVDLLRDTGRMTAEELAHKHLGVDLTKPDFWQASLAVVKGQLSQFAQAVER